jgi:hypothetical protein
LQRAFGRSSCAEQSRRLLMLPLQRMWPR